jgi:hypothetical protein
MKKTLKTSHSGHTLFVMSVTMDYLPEHAQNAERFTRFYVVKNWDIKGVTFMYLGKGHAEAPDQIVAWYPNGKMWSGYGKNIADAIEGAQKDGWLYATNEGGK